MLLVFILLFFIILVGTCKIKLSIMTNNGKIKAFFYIYIFSRICIYKKSLTHMKSKLKNQKAPSWTKDKRLISQIIKLTKLDVELLKLKINISTTDAILTAYISGILASIIGILTKFYNVHINSKKYYYSVKPVYSNQKILDIKLKCIISKNLVHIIFIIYRNVKDWRREKYGRKSSNRRAYGDCNEQY